MRFSSRLALFALPLAGVFASKTPVSPAEENKPLYQNAQEAFRDLLNALPESSLHAALHDLAPFRDGVFESDRHGVERVHSVNPPLATKLIVAAVQDLRKRQNPEPPATNGTVTNTPPPPEPTSDTLPPPEPTSDSQPPPEPTSETPPPPPPSSSENEPEPPSSQAPPPPPSTTNKPPIQVPVTLTSTNDRGEPTIISSSILSEATASAIITTTRVISGSTEVLTETKPAVIVTETDEDGSTRTRTSAVDFVPTRGQVITTTNAEGSTFVTTYTPGAGRISSVKVITTTGADGRQSVVTSFTYVDAQATGVEGEGEPSATGTPGLATGAAVANGVGGAVMLGGLFAGLWL